tara:strand:+ start:9321 stop:10301 length:981 start_codon:yes stop_codon:yes gene_type:complete
MIIKHFQLEKSKLDDYNFFLLYGKNDGLQKEIIEKNFTKNFKGEINRYEENDVLKNNENIIEEILNESLFSSEKILIISRATDKIVKVIEDLLEKKINNIKIIIKSGVLEKRSKLRALFEKNKNLITIPFYEDEIRNLIPILNIFLNKHGIKISRESINLILDRASGNRNNLNNELKKILNYSFSNKTIDFETIKKLTNLGEDYSVNELADQYLSKNTKNVAKILNENNYNDDDCIIILRTILIKSKRLLNIIEKNTSIKDIDRVISEIKPPVFWKDKENVKKQAKNWVSRDLKNKIYEINQIETLIKTNSRNSLHLVSNFVINYQ